MNSKLGIILGSFILGVSIVLAAFIASSTVMQANASRDSSITMTGSATQSVTSDLIKWSGSFSRTVSIDQVKSGYAAMTKDQSFVETFFKTNGIADADLKITPVSMNQIYKNNDSSPTEFTLTQTVQLSSTDIPKIEALSKRVQEIANLGVLYSSNNLEYYYTKLPDVRINLLSNAVGDAKTRAEQIAKSSGQHVGAIRSASMGVVQVLPPHSTDVSDYGTYDTSSKDKDIMVTVKTVFNLVK